jgi:hypothetical protein
VTLCLLKPQPIPHLQKLIRAARLYSCVLCHKDKAYTCAAHCNDARDKGIGKKAPDFMVAYVCGDPGGCHDKIDGRVGGLTKDEKRAMWNEAYRLTVKIWFRDNLVTVN